MPQDDWAVVEEALGGPYVSDEGPALISMPNMVALVAALARLREREAQTDSEWAQALVDMKARAEAAEARVARLEEALLRAVRWAEDSGRTELWVATARRALVHEEER